MKNSARPILLYGLLALGLSAWVVKSSYFIGYDGAYYARVGVNFFSGKGLTLNAGKEEAYTYKPTLYPLLLGTVNLLLKAPEFSGYLISVVAFSLSVIPLFLLTQTVYSRRAAHWASLLYVTNGFLLLHANRVMTESLFTFLLLILLGLLVRTFQEPKKTTILGIFIGLVSGMASLVRIDGSLFYGVGILALLALSSNPLRVRIRTIGASLIVFLLFLLPYLQFIHKSTGRLHAGGAATEILIRRELDLAHPGQYLEMKKYYQGLTQDKTRLKLEELAENFNLWEWLAKDNFVLFRSLPFSFVLRIVELNKYLFGGLGFFFIGASCFSVPWDSKRKKAEFLFLLFLSTLVFQLFSEFIPKRYFFYFPILLIGMGNGIEAFRNWSKETFRLTERGSLAVAGGVCLFFVSVSVGYAYRTLSSFPPPLEYKEMGLWIKENIPRIREEVVLSVHPSVNFYSGARLLGPESRIPYVEKFEDFLTYMAHKKAKYFVVSDDSETPFLTDSYRFLLDETKPPPPRILKRHKVVRGDRKIILYEIQR